VVLQDAFEAAQRFLDEAIRGDHNDEIVIGTCCEVADGWAFGYNTRAFLERGDIASSLVGNGPVIVPASGAQPYVGPIFGST